VLNWIWLGLILGSLCFAAFTGRMAEVTAALGSGAESAVKITLTLVGIMAFMLGVMRVAFDGGLRDWIASKLAPILHRVFPEVPPEHPAMGAMTMNFASNILGLGNAATPFGLKAMKELARLNPCPGSASNAMVLFLAINTSAVTLMAPTGTVGVRMAAGSAEPWAIWIPTLIATLCSTTAAVTMYYVLGRLPIFAQRPVEHPPPAEPEAPAEEEALPGQAANRSSPEPWRWALFALFSGILLVGLLLEIARSGAPDTPQPGQILQNWLLPLLIGGLLMVGLLGRVNVYDSMVAGAKEGLEVGVRILPYLVVILVAVAMLRGSGALDLFVQTVNPVTSRLGIPAEVLPMAILRPLSGSGALGIMAETLEAHGPDSFIGMLTSTLMGSTETTFYVLAIYLGAARVTDSRHALAACLTGDVAGFAGAVVACHWFFG